MPGRAGRPSFLIVEWETTDPEARPYPAPRRRLAKTPNDEVIDGVCGGIAAYFGLDATIVRIVAVVLLFSGVGMIIPAYIALMFILPDAPEYSPGRKRRRKHRDDVRDDFELAADPRSGVCAARLPRNVGGWLLVGLGAYLFLDRVEWINPAIVISLALVTLGINLIIRRAD